MAGNYYETQRALAEYLLFHYVVRRRLLPRAIGSVGDSSFPARVVTDSLDAGRLPKNARGLDLGCAVGRATFELARHCTEVVGIDQSKRFIETANHLRRQGSLAFDYVEEGDLTRRGEAVVPKAIDRERARFEVGDATALRRDLGTFDVVLLANLIDRVRQPRKCLKQLPRLLNSGGQLVISSPYTWLREYTPRKNWLGGFVRDGERVTTFNTLKQILSPEFRLFGRRNLPFVIREHARKFQFGIAEVSVWRRK